ncbi:hypothetical protein C5167_025392 [Papaver somniferum]|uniref:FBD domain-containing protein n=1 Tax=Papaver somniferum TaxID=3469 RepID=A0A4Y7JSC3_PAPSO|nr:hypothetical protein C5167_025392 [Papaver somniferum]
MDLADSRIDYLQLKSYWWDKKNNMSELEDRISNLPASILHHILSFVHTRVAARTSVLSKRWKYIWRSIPSLQFRCHKSSRSEDDDDASDNGSEDNYYNDAAEDEDNNDNEDDGWALDIVAARCSFLHLKLVSFNKFTGDAREMQWLKLILNNATELETLTISCERISNMKSENLMADISSLPRASASCVFKFSSEQG